MVPFLIKVPSRALGDSYRVRTLHPRLMLTVMDEAILSFGLPRHTVHSVLGVVSASLGEICRFFFLMAMGTSPSSLLQVAQVCTVRAGLWLSAITMATV